VFPGRATGAPPRRILAPPLRIFSLPAQVISNSSSNDVEALISDHTATQRVSTPRSVLSPLLLPSSLDLQGRRNSFPGHD